MILVMLGEGRSAQAHPHVFVDGGVNFIFDARGDLSALEVTWRYDLFETLYVLSKLGVFPDKDGALTATDQARIVENETAWPEGFNGAAHLTVAGIPIVLSGPEKMTARIESDRLSLTFMRNLTNAVSLRGKASEVAFYEATYYYAFSVTDAPKTNLPDGDCAVALNPFEASAQSASLQIALAALGREETPQIEDVGALFADRIVLDCR